MNTTTPITSPDQIDYSHMVAKLAKDGAQILSELTKEKCHLWHMATGLAGEAIEVENYTDIENLIEELGDVMFYHEGVRQCIGIEPQLIDYGDFSKVEEASSPSKRSTGMQLLTWGAGIVLDAVKKHVAYNQPLNVDRVHFGIFTVNTAVNQIQSYHGLNRGQILLANKTKLFKRYTGFNYTNEAAQARADKA
jgi:hypothetical protein